MTPHAPALEFAFTITAQIAEPRSAGVGLSGEVLHIPIMGGEIAGPKLNGKILPGGSDWPTIRPDGATLVEAVYTIEATDGTLILVRNRGLRVSAPAVTARLRQGEPVSPSEYYFRSAPQFDAPDGPHQWLRETLFLATLRPNGRQIGIDVFSVG